MTGKILQQLFTKTDQTQHTMSSSINTIEKKWAGTLHTDVLHKNLYATDASIYREKPTAVAIPKNLAELKQLVQLCLEEEIPMIPRGAGTSLAGQVVGNGLVIDTSRHFRQIKKIDTQNRFAVVESGVIRDTLNAACAPHGLLFGPETSTTNRCTMAGMVGNNSCGTRSLVFGSTRDKLHACKMILADGSHTSFGPISQAQLRVKLALPNLEGKIYRAVVDALQDPSQQKNIRSRYPKTGVTRRNHGYAFDAMLDCEPFTQGGAPFNLCRLIAGAEGTLGILTEATVALDPVLPKHQGLLCVHCHSLDQSLKSNVLALRYHPTACELIDDKILSCTEDQIAQRENRFFVHGTPMAILIVEFCEETPQALHEKMLQLKNEVLEQGLAYEAVAVHEQDDIAKVWELRKAGLGLLSNYPGDAKPIAFVEDTAVLPEDLPSYITAFNHILQKHRTEAVHYAHAGSGELHLRPAIDLKTQAGIAQFKAIAQEVAELVSEYRGCISGEHGDGRLRGYFLKSMYGETLYTLHQVIKQVCDPKNLFNPGKIVAVPPIDQQLRYAEIQPTSNLKTAFRYPKTHSWQQAAEACNGSGDCIKSTLTAGAMCPSYMATGNEKDSTRARANALREFLSHGLTTEDEEAVSDVLKLCLSCKACKRECPSNVDMAKLKSEFLHYRSKQHFNFKAFLIARYPSLAQMVQGFGKPIIHWTNLMQGLAKPLLGVHPKRSLPKIASKHPIPWADKKEGPALFVDEFTQLENPSLAFQAWEILHCLGLTPNKFPLKNSYRSAISEGQLDYAKRNINRHLNHTEPADYATIIGLEPAATYTLKDEFTTLCDPHLEEKAQQLAQKTYLLEDYLLTHCEVEMLRSKFRSTTLQHVAIHAHCHQKALGNPSGLKTLLQTLLPRTKVTVLDSGCCGMAGFFGYRNENYEVSKTIAASKLLPAIASSKPNLVLANGTSCQQQLRHIAPNIPVQHPVTFLHSLLEN